MSGVATNRSPPRLTLAPCGVERRYSRGGSAEHSKWPTPNRTPKEKTPLRRAKRCRGVRVGARSRLPRVRFRAIDRVEYVAFANKRSHRPSASCRQSPLSLLLCVRRRHHDKYSCSALLPSPPLRKQE